ncbi:SDR family oxidoreductase [Priestia aryabhattai]|uniref:SDR family oxidoreductase n=1 Tax=Priestia aryabhattai TaxID=412384 RepID=UPI0039A2FC81
MSKLNNPLTQYFHENYPKQYQEPPGVQKEMNVIPDCGENSYIGAGKQQAVEDLADLETDQLRKTFEVNVFSLYWTVKAALPYLPAGASIITTSSVQGYSPSPNLLDYAATKFAINGFTRGLAKQLAPKGIRVNSVAPGPIWTPLQISGGQPCDAIPAFGQDTPLQRAGQPVELANVYVFLASTDASYVTAQVYGITGGIELA